MAMITQATRPAHRPKRQDKSKYIHTHHSLSPMAYMGLNEVNQKKYQLYGDGGYFADPEKITEIVCRYFGVERFELNKQCKLRVLVIARQISMHFICHMTDLTLKQVGVIFKRDYTTVIYAKQTVQDLMDTDKNYKRQIEGIKELLNK